MGKSSEPRVTEVANEPSKVMGVEKICPTLEKKKTGLGHIVEATASHQKTLALLGERKRCLGKL